MPDLPLSAQPWYLDACCADGRWDAVLATDKGRPVAALPYFLKRRGPFRYITMPPFVKAMGPHLLPAYRGGPRQTHPLLRTLLEGLPRVDSFVQNFHPSAPDWLPFYWAGYRQTTRYTFRFEDLSDPDALRRGFNRNVRRNLTKAEGQVAVRHDLPLATFHALAQKSFERQRARLPYAREAFERHDAALAAHDARQLFFAVDATGQVHSAAYLTWDRHTAYYHLSGDDPALRRSGAGLLLVWEALKFARARGLRAFDFEGSILPAVAHVRVQFGAQPVPYHHVWKHPGRAYRWLRAVARR